MQLKIQYFAAARELRGLSEEILQWDAPEAQARAVFAHLCHQHPALSAYGPRMTLAVNDELVVKDRPLREGDTLAILPPVAGGSDIPSMDAGGEGTSRLCDLRTAPLSVDEALAAVEHPGAGGLCVFIGVVRDHALGVAVDRLQYEAHPTLAVQQMAAVLAEVQVELPMARLSALHRVGSLQVGDRAVIIAASAPHRTEAFAACRLAIDRIKERVPIWKKEFGPDGLVYWVNLEGPQKASEEQKR